MDAKYFFCYNSLPVNGKDTRHAVQSIIDVIVFSFVMLLYIGYANNLIIHKPMRIEFDREVGTFYCQ